MPEGIADLCRNEAFTTPVSRTWLPIGDERTKDDLEREVISKATRRYYYFRAQHMRWTDQNVSDLVDLFDAGLTYGQIAARLLISRNAVAGKLYRMGLTEDKRAVNRAPTHFSTNKQDGA